MKIFKLCMAILVWDLCTSVAAANRFIIHYKPNESQTAFLLAAHTEIDEKEAQERIRVQQMMAKPSQQKITALSNAIGVQARYSHAIATGAHVIILDEDLDEQQTEQFIRNVKQDESVDYIEEDRIVQLSSVQAIEPNYQWDMVRTGDFTPQPTWNGDNFVNAWKTLDEYGYIPGQNVVVAVIDTGYTPHPNFINNLQQLIGQSGKYSNQAYGYQFICDCRVSGECAASTAATNAKQNYRADGLDLGDFMTSDDTSYPIFAGMSVQDSSWHGSHVIGTIVGNGCGGSNPAQSFMSGGAYGAKVVPVRVVGKGGGWDSDIANGMMWAAGLSVPNVLSGQVPVNPNPANIISMSLGGRNSCSATYQNAINKILAKGVLIVVAAGNAHTDISNFSPASCNGVITVAAKGPTNKLASYSNYGATTIAASGGDESVSPSPLSIIYSTTWSSSGAYQPPSAGGAGKWESMYGTSMAAPHVSAAVAILIGAYKARYGTSPINGTAIIKALQDIPQPPYNYCSSYGCATNHTLDVSAAVNSILSPACTLTFPQPASGDVNFVVPTGYNSTGCAEKLQGIVGVTYLFNTTRIYIPAGGSSRDASYTCGIRTSNTLMQGQQISCDAGEAMSIVANFNPNWNIGDVAENIVGKLTLLVTPTAKPICTFPPSIPGNLNFTIPVGGFPNYACAGSLPGIAGVTYSFNPTTINTPSSGYPRDAYYQCAGMYPQILSNQSVSCGAGQAMAIGLNGTSWKLGDSGNVIGTLSSYQSPILTNIVKSGYEGGVINFVASDFTGNFKGYQGNSLVMVKITSLPISGILKLSGSAVALNQIITVSDLDSLTYTPNNKFIGSDTFTWNGSDGAMYAASAANVNIVINSSNEPHVVNSGSGLTPPLHNLFKKLF